MNVPSKQHLSARTIAAFVSELEALPPDPSFAHCIVMDDAAQIRQAPDFATKRRLAIELIERFEYAERVRPVEGQTVDYRTWRLGRRTLDGEKISRCPVCNANGVLWPFEHTAILPEGLVSAYVHHVVIPYGGATAIVKQCSVPGRFEDLVFEPDPPAVKWPNIDETWEGWFSPADDAADDRLNPPAPEELQCLK